MFFIFSQFICLVGLIMFVISMQQSEKSRILIWQILSFTMYAIQYFILNAYAGMVVYLLNIVRNIVFYILEKIGKNTKYASGLFIIICICIGIIQFENFYDILPVLTSVINILSIMQRNIIRLKEGQVIASSTWIIYDVLTRAYIAGVSEVIIILAVINSILEEKYRIYLFCKIKHKIKCFKIKEKIKLLDN